MANTITSEIRLNDFIYEELAKLPPAPAGKHYVLLTYDIVRDGDGYKLRMKFNLVDD